MQNDKIKKQKDRCDSGRTKLGAILEDNCYIGCNATLNPGTYLSSGVVIWPGRVVKGYKH